MKACLDSEDSYYRYNEQSIKEEFILQISIAELGDWRDRRTTIWARFRR